LGRSANPARRQRNDGAACGEGEKLESMNDTPKFEVIDRRKIKAEEEKESGQTVAQSPAQPAQPAPP